MLKDGYAYLLTRYPLEPKYEKILRQAFREAVESKRGMWR
jgi:endonuclease YncB( thermonuclease family)